MSLPTPTEQQRYYTQSEGNLQGKHRGKRSVAQNTGARCDDPPLRSIVSEKGSPSSMRGGSRVLPNTPRSNKVVIVSLSIAVKENAV